MALNKLLTLTITLCMSVACLTACGSYDENDSMEINASSQSRTISETADNNSDPGIDFTDNANSSSAVSDDDSSENEPAADGSEDRLSLLNSAALQYPTQNDEWKYNVYDCYIEITEYIGEQTDAIIIPDEIDGLPVWSIGSIGYSNKKISSIKLPEELVIMKEEAFYGFGDIENIDLPDGLVAIEKYAFEYCRSLKSITLPASVQTVDVQAFGYCDELELTVLNPSCYLYDHESRDGIGIVGMIYGYSGSTAAEYAAKFNIPFKLIEE